MKNYVLKGNLCYSITPKELKTLRGYVVCKNGICAGTFEEIPEEYKDAAEKFYNDDTAGKTFDAATGEEVLETIGGADGPTAVITTTLG